MKWKTLVITDKAVISILEVNHTYKKVKINLKYTVKKVKNE